MRTGRKKIIVTRGTGKKICERLSCSKTTVSRALSYDDKTEAPLCEKIREMAITEYRGKVVKL